MIPYGKQQISEQDIEAVVEALRSDFLTQGPRVGEFEQGVAKYCGAKHSVAVNSATSALHLACIALGVGQDDMVWTSPISFTASANCARYCGSDVDFVDIDPETGNMCANELSAKLERTQAAGERLPKVVIVVHFGGQPADMRALSTLSSKWGFRIIEDAAHAIGSSYVGYKTGSCKYSDITVFSFHPVKVITSGEGGMALTNDNALAKTMRLYASHGITKEREQLSGQLEGSWVYEQKTLGYNYRISDLHAALGLSQLSRLDEFVARRNALAQEYIQAFAQTACKTLRVSDMAHSAYHLFTLQLPAHIDRQKAFDVLRSEGLGVNVHYIPIYKQPYYQELGFDFEYCPNAELLYSGLITLPLYPALTPKDLDYVIDKVKQVLSDDSVFCSPTEKRSGRGE